MPKLPLIASAAASALILAGLATIASAAPLPKVSGATGFLVLVEDEEDAEVQNLLEPQSDEGTPMNAEKPAMAPREGGGERALEETVGDDGVNQIQEESIPKD